jgi:hypothetical protein
MKPGAFLYSFELTVNVATFLKQKSVSSGKIDWYIGSGPLSPDASAP